jgi:26S proteasome regulatory subunit N3
MPLRFGACLTLIVTHLIAEHLQRVSVRAKFSQITHARTAQHFERMTTAADSAPAATTPDTAAAAAQPLLPPPAPFPADPLSVESRPALLQLFRSLSLRRDEVGMELVLNALLRNFVHHRHIPQAEQILKLCEVQQPFRSTNQAARFFYYEGFIKAMRLDYAGARQSLSQATRKAPERALGFRIAVTKLFLVVELLCGDIPPRGDFLQPLMRDALAPYLQLTSCVRFGALGRFQSLAEKNRAVFEHDQTYSLILRVRQNVIRMGLSRIGHAYQRISVRDVATKLSLDHPEDAEYIVAKAITDGALRAVIDHENGHVVAVAAEDIYATTEPLADLRRRVQLCNTIHDDARRAMRFVGGIISEEEEAKREAEKRAALERAMDDDDGGDIDFSDGL